MNMSSHLIDEAGVDPGQLRQEYASAGSALSNLYKSSANLDAFSDQAIKNAKLVEDAIGKLGNTDFKDYNSFINALKEK